MDVEKEDFCYEDEAIVSDEPFWVWDPFLFRIINPEVQILGNIARHPGDTKVTPG